jgi:hypothetical protein
MVALIYEVYSILSAKIQVVGPIHFLHNTAFNEI